MRPFMKKHFFVWLCLCAFSVLLLPMLLQPANASAQSSMPSSFPLKDLKFNQVLGVLNTFVSWLFTVFLIVAVIFIIFAAFKYLIYGSNPTEVKKATHMLVFAAVAIAVALLSVSARFIIEQLVTGTGGSGSEGAPFCSRPENQSAPECYGP